MAHQITLRFEEGVTRFIDCEEGEPYAQRLPNFTYACTVSNPDSAYPNKGYVIHHISASRATACTNASVRRSPSWRR
ncbi:hypothetical protein [Paraburkholderia sp. BR10923]|uniref:hypothetical protein n=1 Tax=Paraburkholderia TaxID=1822464 RepID=UPI0034CF94F8